VRIIRARAYGFCFGVRDALVAARHTPDPAGVTIFGELVHNEQVLHELNARGFRQVAEADRTLPIAGDRVLITAHGISDASRGQLLAAGKQLIDTTCPLVRRVHAAAQQLASAGRHVIVIGQPGHVEVRGIVEDLPSWSVFATPDDVRDTRHARLGIVCQSTTRPEIAAAVRNRIAECQPDADIAFADTICQPTRDRQAAVRELLREATVLIVVGGCRSNNSRALVEQARQRGVTAHLVQTADDVPAAWFRDDDVVGLTAGTSTPDDAIEAVAARLEEIAIQLAPGRPRPGADAENRAHCGFP
jgi:4-hydroxy-3-methylbut-2-enyl diphosphate reductase